MDMAPSTITTSSMLGSSRMGSIRGRESTTGSAGANLRVSTIGTSAQGTEHSRKRRQNGKGNGRMDNNKQSAKNRSNKFDLHLLYKYDIKNKSI